MIGYYNILRFVVLLALIVLPAGRGIHAQGSAFPPQIEGAKSVQTPADDYKIIIIDPGHGGQDPGARTLGGQTEKQATLEMARILRRQFAGGFQVLLSRDNDETLTSMERSGRANQARGDLFISLHIRGGFAQGPGDTLALFHPPVKADTPGVQPLDPNPSNGLTPWFDAQRPHQPESRRLAQALAQQLAADLPQWTVQMQGAPLAVLEGLDMPGVLLEADPPKPVAANGSSMDSDWFLPIARSVAKTVQTFWGQGDNGPIIQDLHE